MKKIFYILVANFWVIHMASANNKNDLWLLGNGEKCWVSQETMRNGDITLNHIPCMIKSSVDFLLWLAGTISVIFVIIGAYKILFWGLSQDIQKWRNTIFMALGGFALASLSWFIIKVLLDNF